MAIRWRAIGVAVASSALIAGACAAPTPGPPATATPPEGARPAASPAPARLAAASPSPAPPTPEPTATPTPTPEATLEVRLLNDDGSAEVQVDGSGVEPGAVPVAPGPHAVAALEGGEVVAEENVELGPDQTSGVDLVVPPPLPPLAVVVENHPDARPQSGLLQADVVYEALAEGGITRYLAVYASGEAPVVGPVRSLRHYFAFLAAEYQADLVHIGASPQGFAWRDAMDIGKLDESAGDPGVWRVGGRYAPHNAYTNTARDRELLAGLGRQQGRAWGPLRFSREARADGAPAEAISITFLPSPYRASYTWDAEAGSFRRFVEGAPDVDAETGQQVACTSLVVQFTHVEPIPGDAKGRVDMDLAGGEGRLLVFTGGAMREGSWSKGLPHEPTSWLDEDGEPLVLPPGPVWVEVVPETAEVGI